MPRPKTIFEVLALAVIAAFVAAAALGIFIDLFWSADSKPTEAFRGAFLGAFFAFIFVRLGDALSAIFERKEVGRNALVKLQYMMQDIINSLLERWA